MNSIAFIDTEVEQKHGKVLDFGGIKDNGVIFHKTSIGEFITFLSGTQFICGHNILRHDLRYIGSTLNSAGINIANSIDTLFLSPLLFPTKPYHSLLKDDKLLSEEANNPLNDSIKAKNLFEDEISAFRQTDEPLKQIFYLLLNDQPEFQSFFRYIGYICDRIGPSPLIHHRFNHEICEQINLSQIISEHPIELAYCLALINSFIHNKQIHSITPAWVLKNYPEVTSVMIRLRNTPCISGCPYCNSKLDAHKGLNHFFGFDSFRTYAGEPLQEKAVKAAIANKSLLAVFPTGGGKSITFQLPALMSGENAKGLTVVISPLQSLMKDQVDNLEKIGITSAVTVNGLLDPIERAKSLERVEDGSASILYISPESLRSQTIERLILGRTIARFVIDEAHCFSSWGQDFRVDYLYIGDFIKSIQEKKSLDEGIPVSCFTATAKQKVIEDIRNYFKAKLALNLELFTSKAARTNLQYKVLEKAGEKEKYQTIRDLIEEKNCPTIIYVSRTRKANQLAEQLSQDEFKARAYHGKMDADEKTANQNAFISGEIAIMVATSAFGMGVDKKDVGMVIHHDISDSLENYIQEAGRAGRDENIEADCFVLFNEEDLAKHFILLNQTKLSSKEIQQVWKAVKEVTKFRPKVSNSALEIARKAGWDDNVAEIETRVTTAIAALEDAGYLKRGQNMPRVFANSILCKTSQEAIEKINASERFSEKQKEKGIRIIKKLFSSKSRKQATDEQAESRIDYISDHLGIVREEVINIITLLREEKILADTKDLTAFIKRGENKNRSLHIVTVFSKIEQFMLPIFSEEEKTFHLKEINELAEGAGCENVNINQIKTIINFWAIKNWIKRKALPFSRNHIAALCIQPKEILQEKLRRRHELAKFVVEFLYERSVHGFSEEDLKCEEILVEFSVHELKDAFEVSLVSFGQKVSIEDIEDALFYLSKIEAIKIEGGFLVVYNRLTIDRLEQDNKKRYKTDDYQKLNQFYENKVQQIHIVGEYAKKMIEDKKEALQFVEDYFHLNYSSFLNQHFKGSRQNEIKRNLTPAKFKQLFGELSDKQLEIINDKESKYIVVAAGPGSGKTRVLVHKLASLLLMEDVKHEQLLMLTFSRAAATEFKTRLLKLIGNAANFIEIKTFHSYCFDLLGRVGSLDKSDEILKRTIERIKDKEVEASRITKTVLVVDEAQDMDEDEFNLIKALMEQNEDMRVIAVGDDDQNIYEFRGANSKYLELLIRANSAAKYELVDNYRSKQNLVDFANQFASRIHHRLKETPIHAIQADNGHIKLVRHHSDNLVTPLVQDILTSRLTGTTCVLTKTNDEASQITGVLLKNGIRARLIQSNEGFNLSNILEIRTFLSWIKQADDDCSIRDEVWDNAKQYLKSEFQNSNKLEICNRLIKDFETTNPKKRYKSDLDIFIRESKLEDFLDEDMETIYISTIHKVKGKEFDNVFLMLDRFKLETEEAKRQLYVAITRAKQNLNIHLNSDFFDSLSVENMERTQDHKIYSPPEEIVIPLTHKNIWLNGFENKQHLISQLSSGGVLTVDDNGCSNSLGQSILKFSKKFIEKRDDLRTMGYELKSAKVNFIVYWQNDEMKSEIKIVLPELCFEKVNS